MQDHQHPLHHSPQTASSRGSLFKTILGFDVTASFVVFLVALPLCMGIAQASGAPIASGIITGIVGGLIVGFLAGSPLQVSGPAAGLTVLVFAVIQDHGLAALGLVVLIAGAIQLVAGLLKIGQWFRAVSPAVIRGMLSGIGVLIFASQFHLMVDDTSKGTGLQNLVSIPEAIWKGIGPVELAAPESREIRHGFIQEFGQLHQQQEMIRSTIGDRVSSTSIPAIAELERSALTPLVARQTALLENLEQLAADSRAKLVQVESTSDSSDANERFNTALDAAITANQRALVSLENRDLTTVHATQQAAAETLANVTSSLKNHTWAALLGMLTITAILLWQTVAPRRWRLIPGALVALLLTAGTAFVFGLPVLYVEVPQSLWEGVRLPSLATLHEVPLSAILGAALVFAAVASAETLLCASAVDQMHTGPRTQYDRELAAQGVGNMICGFLGALPMTGVIVRSATNVHAGAKTRFSAILHGAWLLLFVVVLGGFLQHIPTSVLAGILVYTGWKLIDFKAVRDLRAYGWSEVGIFLATMIGIVVLDLLAGVLIGLGLSCLKLLVQFARLDHRFEMSQDQQSATLELVGAASFVQLPKIASALEHVPPGAVLHLDIGRVRYLDHACGQLLSTWFRQHRATGGRVVVDWNSLNGEVLQCLKKVDLPGSRPATDANPWVPHDGSAESPDSTARHAPHGRPEPAVVPH